MHADGFQTFGKGNSFQAGRVKRRTADLLYGGGNRDLFQFRTAGKGTRTDRRDAAVVGNDAGGAPPNERFARRFDHAVAGALKHGIALRHGDFRDVCAERSARERGEAGGKFHFRKPRAEETTAADALHALFQNQFGEIRHAAETGVRNVFDAAGNGEFADAFRTVKSILRQNTRLAVYRFGQGKFSFRAVIIEQVDLIRVREITDLVFCGINFAGTAADGVYVFRIFGYAAEFVCAVRHNGQHRAVVYLEQAVALQKVAGDSLRIFADGDAREARTVVERLVADLYDAVGDYDLAQRRAEIKRRIPHPFDAFGQVDFLQI